MKIEDISIDGGAQCRAELNDSVVADYCAAIKDGATFPAIVVFFDGSTHWLADGFHRYHAHKAADKEEIVADVRNGTKRDAILFSVSANVAHGLRRTNADKRKAVETLLRDAEWAKWSDREVARRCAVGAPLVADVRKAICNPITDSEPRKVVRQGVVFEQKRRQQAAPNATLKETTPEDLQADPSPRDGDTLVSNKLPVPYSVYEKLLAERNRLVDELQDMAFNLEAYAIVEKGEHHAKIVELNQLVRVANQARDRLMDENAELKKQVKMQRRALEKANQLEQVGY